MPASKGLFPTRLEGPHSTPWPNRPEGSPHAALSPASVATIHASHVVAPHATARCRSHRKPGCHAKTARRAAATSSRVVCSHARGHTWRHGPIRGDAWQHVATRADTWRRVATRGDTGQYVATRGNTKEWRRPSTATAGGLPSLAPQEWSECFDSLREARALPIQQRLTRNAPIHAAISGTAGSGGGHLRPQLADCPPLPPQEWSERLIRYGRRARSQFSNV